MDDDWQDEVGEIVAVAAEVTFDGSIVVLLEVPGEGELIEATFPGNRHTVLLTWEASRPIDLDGTTAADRRCQEIVARGVARLNEDLARQRAARARQRRERLEREYEETGPCGPVSLSW